MAKGAMPPKKIVAYVVLCFDTRCPKPNTVALLHSKYLAPPEISAVCNTLCNWFKQTCPGLLYWLLLLSFAGHERQAASKMTLRLDLFWMFFVQSDTPPVFRNWWNAAANLHTKTHLHFFWEQLSPSGLQKSGWEARGIICLKTSRLRF